MSRFSSLLTNYAKKRPAEDEAAVPVAKKREAAEHTKEFVFTPTSNQGELGTIGRSTGTDKVTHHGYHRFYPRFLEAYRSLDGEYGMLEIGIEENKSLMMWKTYFPNLFIYGVDIGVESAGERFRIFKCDQSDKEAVSNIVKNEIHHHICYINDDGSHIPEHQILCFDYLFDNLLIPGGTYIIEDIETSYWRRGGLYGYRTRYGLGHYQSIIEIFKHLLDSINNEFLSPEDRHKVNERLHGHISETTRLLISSITFAQNCIIIVKKTAEEKHFDSRNYRFAQYIE